MELTEEEKGFLSKKVKRFKSETEEFSFIELLLELQIEFGDRSLEVADIFLKECCIPPCPAHF